MTTRSIGPIVLDYFLCLTASPAEPKWFRCLGLGEYGRGAAGSRQQRHLKWETGDGFPLFEDGASQSPLGRKHP